MDARLECFGLSSASDGPLDTLDRYCQNYVPGTARPSSRLTALVPPLRQPLPTHTQLCYWLSARNRARVPCLSPPWGSCSPIFLLELVFSAFPFFFLWGSCSPKSSTPSRLVFLDNPWDSCFPLFLLAPLGTRVSLWIPLASLFGFLSPYWAHVPHLLAFQTAGARVRRYALGTRVSHFAFWIPFGFSFPPLGARVPRCLAFWLLPFGTRVSLFHLRLVSSSWTSLWIYPLGACVPLCHLELVSPSWTFLFCPLLCLWSPCSPTASILWIISLFAFLGARAPQLFCFCSSLWGSCSPPYAFVPALVL